MVRIRVKYLLWLRDKTGISEEVIVLPGSPSLEELIRIIMDKHPELRDLLKNLLGPDNPIIITVNGKTINRNIVLKDGDTVKLIPPVSGG